MDAHMEIDPDAPACPWCSAPIGAPDTAVCPSCGARLIGDAAADIPGVTAIDHAALLDGKIQRRVRRSLGSILAGEDDALPPPSEADLTALAPPDVEVRREMLRLELEARVSGLRAEVAAMAAESGGSLDDVPGPGSGQPAGDGDAPDRGAGPQGDP